MAKYTVKHICGHTHEHGLIGKNADRERRLAWLETVDCPECYKAKQQAEREAANQKAAEDNAAAGLPALTGTEKQVAWAETIRAEKMVALNQLIADMEQYIAKPESSESQRKALRLGIKIVQKVQAVDNAVWWIDNRDAVFSQQWIVDKIKQQAAKKV